MAVGCSTYVKTDSARIIVHSQDLFANWEFDTIVNYNDSNGVDQLEMLSVNYGWASSYDGIYKIDGSTLTTVKKVVFDQKDKLRIVPNPFQEKVLLSWSNDYEKLIIHDLSGRVVFKQDLEPEWKSFEINIQLESGIYLGSLIGKKRC